MTNHAQAPFVPTIERNYSGYRVVGQGLRIDVSATYDGRLGVMALVTAEATGWDRPARLVSDDTPTQFAASEIHLTDKTLSCLRVSLTASFFREGWVVDLEPGMAALLKLAIERATAVTALAGEVHAETERLRAELGVDVPWNWLDMLLPDAAANALLDGDTGEQAVAHAFYGYKPGEKEDAFRAKAVTALAQLVPAAQLRQ